MENPQVDVVKVPIGDLRANEYNPNQQSVHDFQLLVKSMQADGFTTPLLANRDGRIIDGEHRWRAAKVLGMQFVPVVYKDYTEAQMRVATIRHNRARGEHDLDLEANLLADLEKSIGTAGIEDSLGISQEDFDLSMSRLGNTASLEQLARDVIGPIEKELEAQGLSGDGLATVAQHSALILAKGQLVEQDAQSAHIETGINYRLELTFDNRQGEKVKSIMRTYPSSMEFVLAVCEYAIERYGTNATEPAQP